MNRPTSRGRWPLAALLLILALLAGACGGSDDNEPGVDAKADPGPTKPTHAAGTKMAEVQSKGKLVVGTKFDQPLFGLKNPVTNKVEGFDVEVAKLVAQAIFGGTLAEAEAKIEFVETVSANREPFIQEAKVDMVVATYTINNARKEKVDFAGPYYIAGQDILVKQGDTSVKSVTDLNGKKVCSVTGSTSINNVKEKAPQADISTSFGTYSLCVEALADGRVQAVTTDDIILLGFIADNPGKYQLVKAPFTTENYGIGVKKGDDAFRTFINDTLEKSYTSGSWKAAFERTVGKSGQQAPASPKVDRYTAGAAAATTTTSTTVR